MRLCFLGVLLVLAVGCDGAAPTDGGVDAGVVDAAARRDGGPEMMPDAGSVVMRDVPRAVTVARATEIPGCDLYVDAASAGTPDGSASNPYPTITAAVDAASDGAIICVAEGVYAEFILPADKAFTLAGGFQSGQAFTVRDSAAYVSRAEGDGTGSFIRIEGDVAPRDAQLTAIDGFEITGYERGVFRATYFTQRFDITNCYIHDNRCPAGEDRGFGGGFLLGNVSGTIAGNVIRGNTCGFGGGGAVLGDAPLTTTVVVERNRVEANEGVDTDCHGGGLHLRASDLVVRGNDFLDNRCTSWGAGLYAGSQPPQRTSARLEWNVYRGNRAGNSGGGFFCDDSAMCMADHELFDANCGGNVLLDSGFEPTLPTIASFDHMTNHGALDVDCTSPGPGVIINKESDEANAYTFASSVFWNNGEDVVAACDTGCASLSVDVTYSALRLSNPGNATVTFGAGNLDAIDPRFVDASAGDFHLRSTSGHWTPSGYVSDAEDSPALRAGDPSGDTSQQPTEAGDRSEMGAYGNSPEASYVN
ncbi:MAG: right-handed parallel beta-helix repeat-containing protein [Sandaracinaceae bacterium]